LLGGVSFPADYLRVTVDEGLAGNVTVTVTARYLRVSGFVTLFDFGNLAAYLILGGADASPHGDALFVISGGAENNCSTTAWLVSDLDGSASWPAGVGTTVLFSVNVAGMPSVPTIAGVPLHVAASKFAGCQPVQIAMHALLDGTLWPPEFAATTQGGPSPS